MNQSKKNALIILGMHRSGTSVLAGCLHLLGVNMGSHLLAPNESNETGGFENRDIVLMHDILLRDLGVHWDVIGNLPDGWVDSEAARQTEKKLMSLIERELTGDRLWAVKDPRICRLMPLWNRLLNRLNIHPVFVVMVRHPFEVAKSLEKRDQLDLIKGHLLWMVHYRDALIGCMEYPHVMITYDQLLADPLSTLKHISQVLDVAYPHDPRQKYQSIIDFIRPELKYHQSSDDPEAGESGRFSQYDWIYQQFRLAQVQAIGFHPAEESESRDIYLSEKNTQDAQLLLFPLLSSTYSPPEVQYERNHAAAMFKNILEIIGRYERADLSHKILRERALLGSIQYGTGLYAQVFFPALPDNDSPYSEEYSQKILVAQEEWEKISVSIPKPEILRTRHLRFDPLNTQGIVAISVIKLLNSATGRVVWSADSPDSFKTCTVDGSVFILSSEKNLELICTGSDPQLLLPVISDLPDCPLMLEIWMKVSRDMIALRDSWLEMNRSMNALCDEKQKLVSESLTIEDKLKSQEDKLKSQEDKLKSQEDKLKSQEDKLKSQEDKLKSQEDKLKSQEDKLKSQEELTRQYYNELKNAEQMFFQKEIDLRHQKDEMQKQIELQSNELENLRSQQAFDGQAKRPNTHHQNYLLKSWIGQIENDYVAIRNSARWKTGDILVRFMEIMMFRKKQPLVTDHLDQLFQDYHKGQYVDQEEMMRKLTHDLTDMFNSRRWKFGHFIISTVERLILRGKPMLASDHVKEIIDQYRQLKYSGLS